MPVRFLSPSHYQAYGHYIGCPSPAQLTQYFYLDDFDRQHIAQRRRPLNRLGFAIQLVTLRFLGTHLHDLNELPTEVTAYMAQQLTLDVSHTDPALYSRSSTFWDHQSDLNRIYGYQSFHGVRPSFQFLRWLYARAWVGSERPSVLFDLATAWLIEHKILLPGVTTLERVVAQMCERVERRSWASLARGLSLSQRQTAASLLLVDDTTGLTLFDHWRQKPHHSSGPQIRLMLERLSALRQSQLHQIDVTSVSPNRVQLLADFALATPSSRLRRLPPERQVAVLVAGLVTLNTRLQDLILEMVDQWRSDLLRRAQFRFEQARLQSLAAFDQAAFQLRDLAQFLTDLPEEQTLLVADLFSQFPRATIQASIALISQVQQPEHHRYQALVLSSYRSARRFLPLLWPLMAFRGLSTPNAVLDAVAFLQRLDGPKPPSRQEAPRAVISPRWRPLVFDTHGILQLNAYTFCVLQSLFHRLRQREIYITPSERWNDPRQSLIDPTQWPRLRPHICRLLDRHPMPQPEFEALSRQLDDAYRHMNTALRSAPHLRMEIIEGVSRPISTPLEAVPETPDLQRLQQTLSQRLPQVDLPDLMLEVHHLTGFADAFSHLSEKQARASDLPISLCAVLLAEACNIGLEAVADETHSALSLQRLAWVQHNYMRPDTLAEANRWLVSAQSHLRLAQVWGGGDVASADGLRFVVPQRALHGGFNRKYFGTGRGITFFNFMSNQFTGFHHIVIPGTLREALFILDGLLNHNTLLQPTEIMTDTHSYSDVVFGLFWLLGFQFSPRLADLKDRRFWRMTPDADYAALNHLSQHLVNVPRLHAEWDEMLRVAGSLKTGTVRPSQLMPIFSSAAASSSLAKAVQDLGRLAKTLYMLHYLPDETYQRRILTQLNHTESRHKLARRLCYGHRGELRHSYKEGQEEQLGALGLVLNLIVYWNTYYLDQALTELQVKEPDLPLEDVGRITPLAYDHIRILGRYTFTLHQVVQNGRPRSLKPFPSRDS